MTRKKWLLLILVVILALTGCATKATTSRTVPTSNEINPSHGLQVHFIDVGQGASQLIIGPTGKTILIDAGNNDQEKVVVTYLKQQKISRLDIVIGTHPDADHVGGLDAVIDSFEIGKVYMPKIQSNTKTFEDVLIAIKNKGLKVSTAKAGLILDWEPGITVNMIAPVEQSKDTNEMSAVVHLTYGNVAFLFTADAEAKSEQAMLDSKVNLKSDVLMVGHHGSDSSTTQAFLDAVQPSLAVIQVGKDNKYGHPKKTILDRLRASGVTILRNDLLGSIVVTSDGNEIATGTIKLNSTSTAVLDPEPEPTVVYNSCAEVRAAGKSPLHRGDPGYSTKLDRDKDGIACE
ncbi:MAG: MBL fold metallo-hydrolase [Candidatus Cohnella colombiensis]|uniref:MBL fold metallo-hydrolase n=1 Tax=Candidatus Cohnella colombiensis TaxID=3121368 RepID=A0AA95EUT3_9BACL|nr:MAG: MBL fold metallo-hydrolase [Cohnella sp.]